MKEKLFFLIVALVTSPPASGQTLLTAGDRCTCTFNASNFYLFPTIPGSFQPVFGEVLIRLYDVALPPGTVLRYEMFENGTAEQSICTGFITETNPNPSVAACDADNAWQDLQGAVRLSMLSGSVTLHSISLQVGRFSGGQYQRWMGGVVATPDPRLNIVRLPNGQVELSWATNHVGYSLEAAPSLSAVGWDPVSNSVATVGARFSVRLETSDSHVFVRLRKP